MKILDTPRSGKCGQTVAFQSRFGLCLRQHVPQKAALTPARERVCAVFGNNSRKWSAKLSAEQRDRWILAGAQVMSQPRLAQKGPLTGQQLWQAISTVRAIVGLPETLEVPACPVFSQSNVGPLVIENGADGVRLYVAVAGELTEDVMVFGQEPCSRGRYKRRNVSYLGLLPPPIDGRSEITRLYRDKFGEPRPGQKVFIVTCQEKDGWKGFDVEASATVPEPPMELQATATPADSHFVYMHTGCTGDANGTAGLVAIHSPAITESADRAIAAPATPLHGKKTLEGEGAPPI
ncbi:MAG: hypothetical protein NT154_08520 [Verrucomicrobia bacterium]|nr:hypothetical protein [Verrucomicrobiota bacterium]